MTPDPFELDRFVAAQDGGVYEAALRELHQGRKQTHWMWFIFPQLAGLGSSTMARRYAIRSLAEAGAYLDHPLLGPRLVACAEAVLRIDGSSAFDIFGSPDDLKLRSCATLFATASQAHSVFHRILDHYYDGRGDERTLKLLNSV